MNQCVLAAGFRFLTSWYDFLYSLTLREDRVWGLTLDLVNPSKGQRILDIGSGTGTFALQLKESEPEAQIFGVDDDPEILEIARNKARASKRKLDLRRGLAQELPFASSCFDTVTSSLVFHHLARKDKQKALKEIRRVLKPGGRFILADWGKPTGPIERLQFYSVQLLDGFKTTADNVAGRIPDLVTHAGFSTIEEVRRERTFFGILSFHQATKP